ncbi:MAG: hypothetical protein M1814_005541 [Vezdaea aestivalis]|nr:MAG: hypothetical protein M1814_005541 [Vezdaea aestivalis]
MSEALLRPATSTSSTKQKRSAPSAIAAPERKVSQVVLGDILFDTWYPSFYPESGEGGSGIGQAGSPSARSHDGAIGGNELATAADQLYICRCCFKYSLNITPYLTHQRICEAGIDGAGFQNPGQMIYEHGSYQVWEVDGEIDKLFCQNLSLFAKLFLDNKSVFYDVSSFLYYLLVYTSPLSPATDSQIVGFFSKEKMSWDNNNLACILVFPPWQRKGLGRILMSISYEVSEREGRMGGPEKPLSKLGRRSYMSFWSIQVARAILLAPLRKTLTIRSISKQTYILPEDVAAALQEMDVLRPQTGAGSGAGRRRNDGALHVSKARVRAWVEQHEVQLGSVVDPNAFVEGWAPLTSWEGANDA